MLKSSNTRFKADFARWRQFHLTEKVGLRFRAEFFDIFSHPNITSPSTP